MASNVPFIWGDIHEPKMRPISFAEKLKQGNAKMTASDLAARAAKFETSADINFKEIIGYFHEFFNNPNCIQQLMPLAALPGRRKWNIIFSKPPMVAKVLDSLVKFPSLAADDPGISFTPIRRRALLITIPDASPDVSDNEIGNALSRHGTVTRVWKQTWEGFLNIFNGKRLVLIFPSGGTELPPFIIIRNKKFLFHTGASLCSVIFACQILTEHQIAPLGTSVTAIFVAPQSITRKIVKNSSLLRARGRRYSGEIEPEDEMPQPHENTSEDQSEENCTTSAKIADKPLPMKPLLPRRPLQPLNPLTRLKMKTLRKASTQTRIKNLNPKEHKNLRQQPGKQKPRTTMHPSQGNL
ncbi:uncharacterized protein LOC135683784 [Rhopilema esculentum]|uniref:uncharacterized protein LOC135683784 n=1 Tax=Rhopilema esculentum TaxID=499914 RepID=UPI0031E0A3A1